MNILSFLAGLFNHQPVAPVAGAKPTAAQHIIDEAGQAIDIIEGALNTLQALVPNLPAQYQGLVAAVAVPVHVIDAYIDSIETQPAAATPTPIVVSPTGVASTATVLGS